MKKPEPITVLFDANSLMVQRTGVGYYTAGLIASLAKAEPQSTFVGYYYNFLGRKQPPSNPTAPNIHYRPIYHLPGPLVNLLRRFNIQVPIEILTGIKADFILYPNFLSQPSLFKTPNAPVIHDLMFFDHPEWGSDKNMRDLNRFIPSTLRRSDFAIAVSQFTRDRLADAYQYPKDHVTVTFIPPVAAGLIEPDKAQAILDKHRLDKPYLLFVGTLEPRKNLINLLDAYTLLSKKLQQSHTLVLAGKTDWKFQEIKQKIEELQAQGYDIHYLGYIDNDERATLYQHARLMVLTSHYEGFGMQLLEAMQYGVPGAVSDIPVFREIGGGAGIHYFNHLQPSNIAKVISQCLEQAPPPAKSLRQFVESKPDWPEVASDILKRIRLAIGSRKGAL